MSALLHELGAPRRDDASASLPAGDTKETGPRGDGNPARSFSSREVWLPVPEFEDHYEVSNLGNNRRVGFANNLKPALSRYLVVTLSVGGASRTVRVHRVVLSAFCGPPPFRGAHAAHNDGDVTNCKLTNLRWASPAENQADVARHGRRCCGEKVFGARLTEDDVRAIKRLIAAGTSNPVIANRYGVSISSIYLIRHNRTWRHVA